MNLCFFCKNEESEMCGHCNLVYYCSAHSNLHRYKPSNLCLPYRPDIDPVKGKILVASRDIRPEEIVFIDKAITIGPDTDPVCLGCLSKVAMKTDSETGTKTFSLVCPSCKFPTCGREDCFSAPIHKNYECPIFTKVGLSPSIKNEKLPHFLYNIITLLRLIVATKKDTKVSESVKSLMTHNEARIKKYPEVNEGLEKMYGFIKNSLNLDYVTKEDVFQAFGSLMTNCMTFKNGSGRGLYPVGSLISHSCISNLEPLCDPDENLMLRSKVFISKGTELTIRYTTFWDHRLSIRKVLKDKWFFECECSRCKDDTELGTMFSCEQCSDCLNGYLTPVDKVAQDSKWKCSNCSKVVEAQLIASKLKSVSSAVSTAKDLQSGLQIALKEFHPSHFIPMNIKYAIIKSLDISSADVGTIEMALELNSNVLSILNKLDPGVTRDKGNLLLQKAKLQLRHLSLKKSEYEKEEYREKVKIIAALQYSGKKYLGIK